MQDNLVTMVTRTYISAMIFPHTLESENKLKQRDGDKAHALLHVFWQVLIKDVATRC